LNTHSEPYQLTLKEYKKTFDSLYTLLCLFANKYLNDIEASKDIVQVVFIKIWEDNIEFRSEENIKSYLYTSVKNKSLDYIKSKRVKSTEKLSSLKMEDMETEPFYLREVVVLETHNIVEKAIKTLHGFLIIKNKSYLFGYFGNVVFFQFICKCILNTYKTVILKS
jgi:RNA polymerase sigma-70 factor (ECF subfamily)